MSEGQQPPPGWYQSEGSLRWWDGTTWTEHRAPDPSPPTNSPVAARPRPGCGLGCLSVVAVILVPFLIWLALGKPGGSPSAHEACIDRIGQEYDGAFSNPRITSEVENAIAWDVRGRFDGGTFACGFSKDPLQLEQAVVYPGDDVVIVVR